MTVYSDDSCGCRYRLDDRDPYDQFWQLTVWCQGHPPVDEIEAEYDLQPDEDWEVGE